VFLANISKSIFSAIDKKAEMCYSNPVFNISRVPRDWTLFGHAPERPSNHNACMLTKRKKQNVIKKYQTHEGDTGSSQVQIAILTTEIDELVDHLKKHHKDHSSRRGLLRKVGERRRLLRYLKKEDNKGYEALVIDLKLKQAKKLAKPVKKEETVDITDDSETTEK